MTDDPRANGLGWTAAWSARAGALRFQAAALFGLLLAFTRNLTLPATALVLAAGAAVWLVKVGARLDEPEVAGALDPVPDLVPISGMLTWATIFVVFCLWELAAFLLGNDETHPTFSMLTDPLLAFAPMRALIGAAWLLWGWQLSTR
jgi:hypothetical protein